MSEVEPRTAWDFSPVHKFIRQISSDGYAENVNINGCPRTDASEQSKFKDVNVTPLPVVSSLGNFHNIWNFLGKAEYRSPSVCLEARDAPIPSVENGDDEAQKDSKAVRWRDEVDGTDLADDDDDDDEDDGNDEDEDGGEEDDHEKAPSGRSARTKRPRQKGSRKKRRQLPIGTLEKSRQTQASSGNESTDDTRESKSQRRRDVIHRVLYRSTSPKQGAENAFEILKSPKKQMDESKWPVARPYLLHGFTRAISEPPHLGYTAVASRKAKLIAMLSERFPAERLYLSKIGLQLQQGEESLGGESIHIFIDISNIMIGFYDAVKARLSVPVGTRLPRQPFSFHSLSLILARGRPTNKLVLAGSDNNAAIEEARIMGYDVNILARVQKPKELTERQRYFLSASNTTANGNSGSGAASGGSGSESYARAVRSRAKGGTPSREQAVDEIIQMKMGQSLLDACSQNSAPSTMVLASGDAAEAEFSEGFMKFVEYALNLNWKVEVVSFRDNTSSLYRRRDFRERWGDKFRLIELDDFVDCLWWREGHDD